MALSTLLIIGISAAVASGAEEVTSSVLKKTREEEVQKEQAKQATDQIKQQRAQASLASISASYKTCSAKRKYSGQHKKSWQHRVVRSTALSLAAWYQGQLPTLQLTTK